MHLNDDQPAGVSFTLVELTSRGPSLGTLMSSLPDSFSSDPFDRLPSDILVLVYEQLGLHDLSSLGRTSSANRELVS